MDLALGNNLVRLPIYGSALYISRIGKDFSNFLLCFAVLRSAYVTNLLIQSPWLCTQTFVVLAVLGWYSVCILEGYNLFSFLIFNNR